MYATIPFQIRKSSVALFLSEVLYLALREEESNPSLFSFMYHAFQLFDNKDKGMANFHLWFMLQFARFQGILTAGAEFSGGDRISADLQLFYQIPDEASVALNQLMTSPLGPPDVLTLSNQNRNLLLDRIIRHYSNHLDGFSRLKSFSVLKEVFG
jgi:DNA repair protein RecO (recombination protein O)